MTRIHGRRRFYFSLRSPYSWLAYLDLTTRHPALACQLEWLPFWEPDEETLNLLAEAGGEFTYAVMSRPKHLYVLQDMRRQTQARGLAFAWPVDRSPRWEVPHAAYLVAARAGAGRRFLEVAHRARWQEGRDICAPATVADLAAEVELPGDELASAADRPSVQKESVDVLLTAYQDGVFGVPFFINGFAKFWGVERLAAFAASFGEAETTPATGADPDATPRRALAVTGGRGLDEGHAGGCG